MRLIFIFLTLLPMWAMADQCAASTSPSAASPSFDCAETGRWQFSLAIGAGHRSNPLLGGRNFPLYLMPDLNYYGKNWFFDNGTLGYSWVLADDLQLSLISRLNEEKGYFRRHHLSNVFTGQVSGSSSLMGPAQKYQQEIELSVAEQAKRPTAFDAGWQLDWFTPFIQWKLNWLHDVSGQYHGQHASIAASHGWQNQYGHWQLSSALTWKSSQLINTYYALDQSTEAELDRLGHSWQPELKLSWNYPLTRDWSMLAFYRYRWLDDAITVSPLVAENSVRSWFLGVSYRFF
jgi:outer membrane protein